MSKETINDKKRERKQFDKMNKEEFFAHISSGIKAYQKQKLTEILTPENIKMMS